MKDMLTGLLSIVLCLSLVADSRAERWQVRATDDVGVEITCSGSPIAKAHYVFWGANWKFAGTKMQLGDSRDGTTNFTGACAPLDLGFSGSTTSPRGNQLTFTWNIEASKDLQGIIGGGLEWNLALNSPSLGGNSQEPELLDGDRGWRWPVGDDQQIRVEFDRPLSRLYFEQGNRAQIRALFVGEAMPKGRHAVTMTVTLPQGGTVAKPLAEQYGPTDTQDWYSDAMRHDASPIDLSFLNHKPAGKHGFVRADADRLAFADGTEARFWGGNIAAYSIFSEKPLIESQARRIAALGYNLMRFHHHDSTRWVGHTVIDKSRSDSRHLDDEVMDRLDYWIKCLKDEGVYIWLDLHVGRVLKSGDEIGDGFAEMVGRGKDSQQGAEGKGFCYYNDRIETLMQEFNEKYLSHVNRYTGVAYKDEPAVMGLLITNENDLTNHFGNLMLADKGNPWHHQRFNEAVSAFAKTHLLPEGPTGRTWEPGPSKLFLADREYRWNVRMLEHLQGIGAQVPVATTQMWGNMNMCGLPALSCSGIIDVHSYGKAEALSVNPRYQDNFVHYMATGALFGKPVAITEWNVPYPAVDRFTAPLYVASIAALQGWDAPMIYNYSQRTFERPSRPGTWSTFPDPAITGVMPAAALLYRRGDVAEAKKTYCLMFDRESLYYQARHPRNLTALRTLVEQSKVAMGLPDVDELDWDQATSTGEEVIAVTDLDQDFIPAGREFVRSDNGHVFRNWVSGAQAINTPHTQAAHGWIGGKPVRLGNVTVQVETPKAAVSVSSLDGEVLGRSSNVLITAVARVVASPGNRMPLLSEPVRGELFVKAPAGLRLLPLDGSGEQLPAVDAAFRDGRYTISLPAPQGTHWFLLTK